MKMDIFSSGLFWGAILILIGISIILKVIFHINIPVIRILFALLLIYWGIKLITGISFKKQDENTVVFGKGNMHSKSGHKEYNVIFSNASVDLTDDSLVKREVNVVFGKADILIDETKPLRIKSSSAFGAINFPDETMISFGERVYKTKAYTENEKYAELEVNVVFGNANIIKRESKY
jgi:predicted membrane protein